MSSKNYEKLFDEESEDDLYDYDYDYANEDNNLWPSKAREGCDEDGEYDNDDESDDNDDEEEYEEYLKEQLDMHSMILSKCEYNDEELDEPIITAEQVLDEIDSMMTMQVKYIFIKSGFKHDFI